jgi:hypothetical protein
MASHTEIKVGSTEWVVRIDGEDVPVKVMEKAKKQSGRGYEFRLRRVGPDGRVFGRNLTRGSGALRRPGDPVKAFGGKSAKGPAGPQKKARRAPPRRNPPKRKPAPATPSFTLPQAPNKSSSSGGSSSLPSLRGRGRSSRASSSPKKAAPAQDGMRFRPKNELIRKTMRALEKLPENADPYMIRNTVADVLAKHESARYFAPFQATRR